MAVRPRIDPVVWRPPPLAPRARQTSGPDPLPPLDLLPLDAHAPEDVVIAPDGSVITGVEGGRILRVTPRTGAVEQIGDTGGRPLGLEALPDGDVLICDSHRGLLQLDVSSGEIETLVDQVDGVPLRFCSNAAAAEDGTIYFTDSTTRFGFEHWRAAVLEATATGRLLRRTPDGQVDVLLDGLRFANGVVLAPDGHSVVVAELAAYRLTRVWVAGRDAGASATIAELPGFPDNLSLSSDGHIWVAIVNPRDRVLDWLHRSHPLFRKAVWALPQRLLPDVTPTLWVMEVAFDGRVVRDLQTPGERYHMVTGLAEHEGALYLASLAESALAVLDLAPVRG